MSPLQGSQLRFTEMSSWCATLPRLTATVEISVSQIIESTTDGAMLRAHTRANNCLFSAPKGQGNVTSRGPKIIARSFSMVTKENTLRVNCTSPLDLLTDGLLSYLLCL